MPSKPYTLSSLKTLLSTVYHTNDNKYIFKIHLETCCTGTLEVAHKNTFQDHFMNKPIYTKTCTIFDMHMP